MKQRSSITVFISLFLLLGQLVPGFYAKGSPSGGQTDPLAVHDHSTHDHSLVDNMTSLDTPEDLPLADFGGALAGAPIAGLHQSLGGLSNLQGVPLSTQSLTATTGTQKVVVLRVYFHDYTNTSRYTKAEVEGFFGLLSQLWKDTSYGAIDVAAQVTDQFQLPSNRSAYIDDGGADGDPPCDPTSGGDLSCGAKFDKVLLDAIANAPAGLDWTGLSAVFVVMAETSATQFHRGQASGSCSLPMGPGGSNANVGCGIFSENPSETDRQVWGRWAHELGHAFQEGGPAHPSNYNNEFELMDSNYPGQTGVFEKQAHTGFPGWLPSTKYQVFTPASGGGTAAIWAEEYPQADKPNIQAVKVEVTGSLYYLVSVRRRVFGDELNGDFASGIPDEGVLIERVSEGSDPWVTVQGPGGDRNKLWKEGGSFGSVSDGVFISIAKKIDDDNYLIRVSYNEQYAFQPDVALHPWTSPPGNTWETTDIWIDSPVNGFGTYSFGFWNDLSGNPVPVGNGDIPVIGMANRVYARVRNIGGATATDVVVHWERTDPPGVGIAGASGWLQIGQVDKTQFPGLASIPPGGYVDVYTEWTPNFPLPEEDLVNGTFGFHTCLRVILDKVSGETVFGNQDGDREQENISTFQASETSGGEPLKTTIRLHNDDKTNPKFFYLSYKDDIPAGWLLDVNGGAMGVELAPDEVREIPVTVEPTGMAVLGSVFSVDIQASSIRPLVNDLDPTDEHMEFKVLGGVRVETRVQRKPEIFCDVEKTPNGIFYRCDIKVDDFDKFYNPDRPFSVMLVGLDPERQFVEDTANLARVDKDGHFEGYLNGRNLDEIRDVTCLFASTVELASASCGIHVVEPHPIFLPLVVRPN